MLKIEPRLQSTAGSVIPASTALLAATSKSGKNARPRPWNVNEQTIDTVTADVITHQGYDAAAKEKAANLLKSFRDYIEQHKAEITALQILYSRPYSQRLTEKMLKELEKKLRENHAAWTEDRLWDAFAVTAPGRVRGRSQAGRPRQDRSCPLHSCHPRLF